MTYTFARFQTTVGPLAAVICDVLDARKDNHISKYNRMGFVLLSLLAILLHTTNGRGITEAHGVVKLLDALKEVHQLTITTHSEIDV